MPKKFEFVARSFSVELPLHPSIPLIPASASALATELLTKMPLSDIHISDERWEYKRPHITEASPRGLVRIVVRESFIKVEDRFPASTKLEPFERLLSQVLSSITEAVGEALSPAFAFGVKVELEYAIDFGTDARVLLLEHFGLVGDEEDRGKMACFGRPCHVVGLRLGFPPFFVDHEDETPPEKQSAQTQETSGVENSVTEGESLVAEEPEIDHSIGGEIWQATVTINTLEDDPQKVSVKIEGIWSFPCVWNRVEGMVTNRLAIAADFTKNKIGEFLAHFGETNDEE